MKKEINRQKFIVYWLYTGLLMSMLIVVIGGITRLTNSGLSMVEWELIMDMAPPVSESQWNNKFEDYKKFPEYKKYNQEMSISEFKLISDLIELTALKLYFILLTIIAALFTDGINFIDAATKTDNFGIN